MGIDTTVLPTEEVMRKLVFKYVGQLEIEESAKWCKCLWATHPDDQSTKRGNCRECGESQGADVHKVREFDIERHAFKGIRKRRVDEHAECPVHTREGLVLYFFEWMFSDAARD